MPISRRQFALGAGGAVAAAVAARPGIASGVGVDSLTSFGPAAESGAIVGIDRADLAALPVPFGADLAPVAVDDLDWLDVQAQRYWSEYASGLGRPLDKYDQADFWFRYLAIPATERALDGVLLDPAMDREAIKRDLGLIHRVGYYGGIWFFKKLEEFVTGGEGTPEERQTASCDDPTTSEPDFSLMARTLGEAIDVVFEGSDRDVLAYAENSIRDGDLTRQLTGTAAGEGLATRFGLIGGYSYNVGYTNAILVPDNRALPPPLNPAGPDPFHPPYNTIEFTPNGVFDCVYPAWAAPGTQRTKTPVPMAPTGFEHEKVPYLVGDTPAMAKARGLFESAKVTHREGYLRVVAGVLDPDGNPYPAPRGDLHTLSQLGFNTGTATWTAPGLLDIRSWDEPSYHLIVALSIYFVQALQLAGCASVAAAATQDADLARRAVCATAVALPFGLSYLIGAGQRTNEHYACLVGDEVIPGFVFAP